MQESKKMLCLSLHPNGEDGVLRIEREDYYRRPTRPNKTEHFYEDYNPDVLVQDPKFYQGVMFWVTVILFNSRAEKNYNRVVIMYPHFRVNTPILRIDEEVYVPRDYRELCEEFPVSSLDYKMFLEDDVFQSQFARLILKHLPLSSPEHFFVTQPERYDREIELKEKNTERWQKDNFPPLP
jgi:hypothetical protein